MSQKSSKSDNFIIQGSILAVAAILVRVIGLLYRIPLVNIVGKEGMAYYSSAFQIYNIILLISSYSMPAAISKMISARLARKELRNIERLMRLAFFLALIVGSAFGLVTLFGADYFAKWILNLPLAAIAIRMLAPAIFIMAFLGILRGFFQGLHTMIPTALSQLFEQIINAIVSIGAAYYLYSLGTRTDLLKGTDSYAAAMGAAGGTLGTTMGALTALLFTAFVYAAFHRSFKRMVRKDRHSVRERNSALCRALAVTIVPIILSTAAYNLIDLVDNSIYGYYMTGMDALEEYKVVWGTYTGMYLTLIHVPVSFASALAASLMPSVTAAAAAGNKGAVITKINLAIKVAMIIAIPSAIGLAILAKPLMALLFSGSGDTSDAALYLVLGSASVIFISLSTVTNAVLQGINRMRTPVIHAVISLAIHTVVLAILLWGLHMGIVGVIFAYLVFAVSMCTLNILALDRALNISQKWMKNYILPFFAAAVMGAAVWGLRAGVEQIVPSNLVIVAVCLIAAVLVYALCLLLFRVVDEIELYDFPMGARLVRAAKKLHLLR